MRKLYDVSRHMDERIDRREVLAKEATTHVWLVNEGIECNDRSALVTITFSELRQELIEMREAVSTIVQKLPGLIEQTRATALDARSIASD